MKQVVSIDEVLGQIALMVRPHFGKGQKADYIPRLLDVPSDRFGMALCHVTGEEHTVGDADTAFSAQSLTKLWALGLALNRLGDEVWTKVGKEPSGTPFNYLSQLEHENGIPRNPFINAGALAVTDLLLGMVKRPDHLVRDFMGALSGAKLEIDSEVERSEYETAHKNRAIAHLMKAHGVITHEVEDVISAYCGQCALTITCRQLARAALPLAAKGFSPLLEETIFPERLTRRLNALLLTCGVYDSVGSFAYRIGLPSKSGVGGGIVAIVPGQASLAVWSPELDRYGTSVVVAAALEAFSGMMNCSVL